MYMPEQPEERKMGNSDSAQGRDLASESKTKATVHRKVV